MRAFYCLVLLIGLFMAVLVQVVTIALPRDAFVASVLSKSPASWELTLDDTLKSRLAHDDAKAELIVAMQKRASFRSDVYSHAFFEGCGLIILSAVGLIRETKINRMRKRIERAASPNAGPAGDPFRQ